MRIEVSNPLTAPRASNTGMHFGLRVVVFALLFVALQLSWQSLRGTVIEHWLVHDATVVPAAYFVNELTPNVQARAVEFSLRAPGGGLNILNGCEGIEALFLLVAAFAIAPFTWRSKALGLLLGVVFVFVVNQLRILALFYAYRMDRTLFAPLHEMVAPMAVIVLVAGFFYYWLALNESRRAKPT
jgi:exosortase family protein XrtM